MMMISLFSQLGDDTVELLSTFAQAPSPNGAQELLTPTQPETLYLPYTVYMN